MPALIRNEHIKLFSNWCNAVATAFITVGILTPVALKLYGPPTSDPDTWPGSDLFPVCLLVSISIHLIGQLLLKALKE